MAFVNPPPPRQAELYLLTDFENRRERSAGAYARFGRWCRRRGLGDLSKALRKSHVLVVLHPFGRSERQCVKKLGSWTAGRASPLKSSGASQEGVHRVCDPICGVELRLCYARCRDAGREGNANWRGVILGYVRLSERVRSFCVAGNKKGRWRMEEWMRSKAGLCNGIQSNLQRTIWEGRR